MNLSEKRVLVTGGAGFIGSRVTREFISNGASVAVVDNCFAGKEQLVPDEAELHTADIRHREVHDVIFDVDPDIIVHLAAIHYIPYCNENPKEAFDVNVMGTRRILEAARSLDNLEKVVFASSAAVYPPREEANSEDSILAPIDVYGDTKLLGEDLMRLFALDTGVPTAAARLFNVYGDNETNMHLIPAILEQVVDGKRQIELGNLTPQRDFVHVADAADAFVEITRDFDGSYRPFNVGTGTQYSVREVVELTSDALGEDIEIVQDQDRVRESDRQHLLADPSRLIEETGWTPQIELRDGLEQLLTDSASITA